METGPLPHWDLRGSAALPTGWGGHSQGWTEVGSIQAAPLPRGRAALRAPRAWSTLGTWSLELCFWRAHLRHPPHFHEHFIGKRPGRAVHTNCPRLSPSLAPTSGAQAFMTFVWLRDPFLGWAPLAWASSYVTAAPFSPLLLALPGGQDQHGHSLWTSQ